MLLLIFSSFVTGQHFHGIRHHHGDGRFWFDLSEVPNPTTVISAELRLYMNYSMVQQENVATDEPNHDIDSSRNKSSHDYLITLYEIGVEGSMIHVGRLELNQDQEGWIAFNVSLVLDHWLVKPEENFGLQLVCRSSASGRFSELIINWMRNPINLFCHAKFRPTSSYKRSGIGRFTWEQQTSALYGRIFSCFSAKWA